MRAKRAERSAGMCGSILSDGILEGVDFFPSTHFNERPVGTVPQTVVLHNISLPAGHFGTGCVHDLFMGVLDTNCDPSFADLQGFRVSSHFFIARDGKIRQYVSCDKCAWHAGVSRFLGRENYNDFSIGIELEGTDALDFEEAQYASLLALLRAVDEHYRLKYIVAHSDIAPGRKTDPGPHFDWVRLFRERARFGSPEFPGPAARMQLSELEQSFPTA